MDTLLEALVALVLDSGGLLGEVLAGTRSGLGLLSSSWICGFWFYSGSLVYSGSTLVLVWFSWGSTLVLLCLYSGALLVRRRVRGKIYTWTWSLADTTSSKSLHWAFFEILALENDEAMQGTRKMAHTVNDRRSKAGQGRMAGEGTRGRGYAPICAPRREASRRLASTGLSSG
ncbi:unnamed protein product [Rhizoctonia solani]|uniref:Uncharacterized protein n=1 Tax=Rhizoctonia solani TaxID=456999 RepID=A0A8H2ZVD7_9AGAM|nr:unnamed protein product [Rhizoctonia solani]